MSAAITTMSQARAMSEPPATANPRTLAIVGLWHSNRRMK
jgi:hypothetical protein